MKYLLFLFQVLFTEAKRRNFILKSLFFAGVFTIFSMVFVNHASYLSFILSEYSIFAKIKILFLIFLGSFQAMSLNDNLLLILTSILFGLNLELVLRKMKFVANQGNLHLTFGAGIITLAATGCASCGLSIASIVGLSAVLAALPFGGVELYLLSILILIASLIYNLHTLVKACKITR